METEYTSNSGQGKKTTQKRNIRDIFLYVLIIIAVLAVGAIVVYINWKRDMEKYPADKVEAFLEACFMEDTTVRFNETIYFTSGFSGNYMPFIATVTLPDGARLTYTVNWQKGSSVDDGLYVKYGEELIEYYGNKYGIICRQETYWTNIMLERDDLEGEDPPFAQFMMALYTSSYIMGGQELNLHLYRPEMGSITMKMSLEEPLNIEELIKEMS